VLSLRPAKTRPNRVVPTNDPCRKCRSHGNTRSSRCNFSNGELLMSVPGTQDQRAALAGCVIANAASGSVSRFGADEMAHVVQRMAQQPTTRRLHPLDASSEGPPRPPTTGQVNLASISARIT